MLAGDREAFRILVVRYQRPIFRFLAAFSLSAAQREELAQEAFLRAFAHLGEFDAARATFSSWLFTIAKRLYVNALQKQSPVFDTDTVSSRHETTPTPVVVTGRSETINNVRRLLNSALAQLNERQREIVLLFHQQNWPIADIASYLNMPEGTVKSHLHRARKRMRKQIMADRQLRAQASEVWS